MRNPRKSKWTRVRVGRDLLDTSDIPKLKVWCGRRDEAHRNKKGEVRRTLVNIERVETGRPVKINIPKGEKVPLVCEQLSVSYETLSRSFPPANDRIARILALIIPAQAMVFDWEKGRRLWTRSRVPTRSLKINREVQALREQGVELDPDTSNDLSFAYERARRQNLDAFSAEPFPGCLRVTCPVCGTVYRLMLFADVAEWLDKQVGKTRFVSAKHLEKLSLEMMAKLRQAGLLRQDAP